MNLADVHELVDSIQQILTVDDPYEEELIELAGRHDGCVEEVRKRLEAVEDYLQRGLRTEALELAEIEPPLIDVVSALDFPELDLWSSLLQEFEIHPVRALPMDIAAELNDAYSASGSVEKLLQRFRALSLSRGPLIERVGVLRQLRRKDADNPMWGDHLPNFETHHLRELKDRLEGAIRQQDLAAVTVIHKELGNPDWCIAVPSSLRQRANDAHAQLRAKAARAELESLSHRLSDAYADFNVPLAKRFHERFYALQDLAGLSEDDPLLDVAGPALEWIENELLKEEHEQEHQGAVRELQVVLDGECTHEDLERSYHQATRHGHRLPPVLEARLADRVKTLDLKAKRRRVAIVTTIVTAAAIMLIGLVFFVQRLTFQQAVAAHTAQLEQLIAAAREDGNLKPTSEYVSRLENEESAILRDPAIAGLRESFAALRAQEDGRLSQIDQLVSSARIMATGDPRWEAFEPAFRELREAESLTKNASERARIRNAEQGIREVQLEKQRGEDEQFREEMADISETLKSLRGDNLAAYQTLHSRLQALTNRKFVSAELIENALALLGKVSQEQALHKERHELKQQLDRITAAAGSLSAYSQALQEFVNWRPDTQRSREFEQVLNDEAKLWRGVDEWNSLRESFRRVTLKSATPDGAAQIVERYATFQQESGPYPGSTGVDRKLSALRAIAARKPKNDSSLSVQLREVFSPRTIADAYAITLKDGPTYYCSRPPVKTGSGFQVQHFTSLSGTQTTRRAFSINSIRTDDILKGSDEELWFAPQSRLAKKADQIIRDQLEKEYEETIVELVSLALAEPELDPVLRLLLVELTLQFGADGSVFIADAVESYLDRIGDLGVSRLADWVVPDESLRRERSDSAAYLETSGELILKACNAAITARNESDQEPIGPPLNWIGWLHRDVNNEWKISLGNSSDLAITGRLVAVFNNGQTAAIETIGMIDERKIEIGASALLSDEGLEGRPVYLIENE